MSEEDIKQDIKELAAHDLSLDVLQVLITAYIYHSIIKKRSSIPQEVCRLILKYYPKQWYIMILNAEKTLDLLLCDTSTTNVKISSLTNTINISNKKRCGTCYQKNYLQDKDGIFMCCENDCSLLLYSNDFNLESHTLPSLPFENEITNNNPVYCENYGLLLIESGYYMSDGAKKGRVAALNVNKDNFSSKQLKWDIKTLPDKLSFAYAKAPSYCLVNNNDLFIINGNLIGGKNVQQTAIYNLKSNEYKILRQHINATSLSGIVYDANGDIVYIGGGEGTSMNMTKVYYYDFSINQIFGGIPSTFYCYKKPTMWTSESGKVVHIAVIDTSYGDDNKGVFYEFIDLRAPYKWIINDNISQITKTMWKYQQLEYLSIVGCK